MFPTVPLSDTRLRLEDFPQAVHGSTRVLDVLSEFIPGQKLIAQIQFQLANGAYRATIAQRDVTLALPFSAKPGDSLELEVVETEGRIAFAVAKPGTETEKDGAPPASSSTTLSRTGQLIGQLLQHGESSQQKPAPLNAGAPVLKSPPTSSQDVAPALQQAVNRSGLFYESHQAAWAAGQLAEAEIRQEPQAQLAKANLQKFAANATLPSEENTAGATELRGQTPRQNLANPPADIAAKTNAPPGSPANLAAQQRLTSILSAFSEDADNTAGSPAIPAALQRLSTGAANTAAELTEATDIAHGPTLLHKSASSPSTTPSNTEHATAAAETRNIDASAAGRTRSSALPAEIAPIVQQQLSSLANNVYPFQGAIWPGQQILWEIVDENGGRESSSPDEAPRQWMTRLKLLLPSLGDIDATIQLDGNDILVQMKAGETHTRTSLKGGIESLRSRLELAGLRLMSLEVKGYERDEPAG